MITDSGEEEFDPKVDRSKVLSFGLKVKEALQNLWEDATTDVFDIVYVASYMLNHTFLIYPVI